MERKKQNNEQHVKVKPQQGVLYDINSSPCKVCRIGRNTQHVGHKFRCTRSSSLSFLKDYRDNVSHGCTCPVGRIIGWDCLRVLYSVIFGHNNKSNFTSNGTQRGTNEILKFGRTISQVSINTQ